MSKVYQPTPEQLALAEERKRLRDEKKANTPPTDVKATVSKTSILQRAWFDLRNPSAEPHAAAGHRVRVMSWNLLAQCLIRRNLFPTSDCLKAAQREAMTITEILSHEADICCMQEVDRLDKLLPMLDHAGYGWVYACGPRKKHGCLIAYSKELYEPTRERVVRYDEQELRDEGSERARRGSSFWTKNIASLVALRRLDTANEGVIVATTHLFWHPSYVYERTRQTAILLREAIKFRDEGTEGSCWPCVIAGDFNYQPDDPAYSLLAGDSLLPEQQARLLASRVVHVSIDPEVPLTAKGSADEEDGGDSGDNDGDKAITNARAATDADGLFTPAELIDFFGRHPSPVSAYDQGQGSAQTTIPAHLMFGSRVPVASQRHGAFEPVWTSYTHYWKSVLDYIFVLNPPDCTVVVEGLAQPHRTEDLGEGIPLKGVCASDHISMCAQLHWARSS